MRIKRDLNRLLVKATMPSIPAKPRPVMPKPVRITRGPTIRWDINYDKLFKDRRKK